MSLTRTQMFICILQGFTSVYVFRHNYYAEYHFLCMCMLSVTLCVWLLLCCRVRRGLPVWSISRPRICSPRKSWSKKMTVYRSAVFFFLFFCHMMHQNLNFLPQNSGYCGIIKKKKTEPKNPDRHRVCASRNFVFASLYSSYWVCCYVVYQILTGVVLEHWTTTWYLTWSVITNRLSDVTRRKRELFPSAAQTVWEQRFFKLLYNFH